MMQKQKTKLRRIVELEHRCDRIEATLSARQVGCLPPGTEAPLRSFNRSPEAEMACGGSTEDEPGVSGFATQAFHPPGCGETELQNRLADVEHRLHEAGLALHAIAYPAEGGHDARTVAKMGLKAIQVTQEQPGIGSAQEQPGTGQAEGTGVTASASRESLNRPSVASKDTCEHVWKHSNTTDTGFRCFKCGVDKEGRYWRTMRDGEPTQTDNDAENALWERAKQWTYECVPWPTITAVMRAYVAGAHSATTPADDTLDRYKSRVKWLEDRVAQLERDNRQWADMDAAKRKAEKEYCHKHGAIKRKSICSKCSDVTRPVTKETK